MIVPAVLDGQLRRAEISEFQFLRLPRRCAGFGFAPLHPSREWPVLALPIFVSHRDPNFVAFFEPRGPARLEVVITASMTLKCRLQRLGREGVHVGILQAQVAQVAGRSELNADHVPCMLARTARHGALLGLNAMGGDLAGHTQFAGGFFVGKVALRKRPEVKLSADIG
jgi:hypothetical protein